MAGLSNYTKQQLALWLFRNTDMPAAPDNVYASFHTADPGATGANEVTGGSYARVACSTGTAGTGVGSVFNAPSAGAADNASVIQWPDPTGTWPVTHVGLWDAATAGNFLIGGDLNPDRTFLNGDQDPQIPIGSLDFAVTVGTGGLSTYLANAVLNWMLRNTDMAGAPNAIYHSLHTADPAGTGANEMSGSNYARASATTGTAGSGSGSAFNAPTNGTTDNASAITHAAPTGAWGTYTHGGFWDALTTGNFLVAHNIDVDRPIAASDLAPSFAAGAYDFVPAAS